MTVLYEIRFPHPLCPPSPTTSTPSTPITVTISSGGTVLDVMKEAAGIDKRFHFTTKGDLGKHSFLIDSIGGTSSNMECYWSFCNQFDGSPCTMADIAVTEFSICCSGFSVMLRYEPVAIASLKGSAERQSPIDIVTNTVIRDTFKPLALTFWNVELSGDYENTGHTVRFTPSKEGPLIVKDVQHYKVCQFHIHWGANSSEGSEHLVNGHAYAGELHIVSIKDTLSCEQLATFTERDDALVIGVLLKAVNNPIANTVWEKLSPVPIECLSTRQVSIQLNQFLPIGKTYYFYEGSLTTEPYNEIVQWYLLNSPIEIPEDYLVQLRSTLNKEGEPVVRNFRAIQPLNARKIWHCAGNCIADAI